MPHRFFNVHRIEMELNKMGIDVIAQKENKHRSGILITKIKHPKEIVKKLAEKNIIVSARGEGVRISNSIFNNEKDVETLMVELKEIIGK